MSGDMPRLSGTSETASPAQKQSRGGMRAALVVVGMVLVGLVSWFWPFGQGASTLAEQAIDQASSSLPPDGGGNGGSGTGPQGPQAGATATGGLTSADARVLLRSEAILQRLDRSYKPRILDDSAVKLALEAAHKTTEKSPTESTETILEQVDVASIGTQERDSIGRQAEALIADVALRFTEASLDHALERLVKADVELGEILMVAKKVTGTDSTWPKDALALAPTKRLQAARDGLRSLRNRFADVVSLAGNGTEFDELLRLVEGYCERLDAVIASSEHHSFQESGKAGFKKIPEKTWQDAMADHDSRVEAASVRRQTELRAQSAWQELQLRSHSIRGPPPEPLDALLLTAVREFDADPRSWVRTHAKVVALGDELASIEQLPEAVRGNAKASLQRVLCLLDEGTLRQCLETTNHALHDHIELPADVLFPDRIEHFKRYAVAIRAELERRSKGGSRIDASSSPQAWAMARLYANSNELTPRAEILFVGLVAERFSKIDVVPPGLRADARAIHQATLERYGRRINILLTRYTEFSDALALATELISPDLATKTAKLKRQLNTVAREYEASILRAERVGVDVLSSKKALLALLSLFPRGPPDEPPPPSTVGPVKPLDPEGPPSSPGAAELRVSQQDITRLTEFASRSEPRLEKSLFYLEAHLKESTDLLGSAFETAKALDREPKLIAKENGRRTLTETDIVATKGAPKWETIPVDETLTRLPKIHENWLGRVKNGPDGKPVLDRGKPVIFDYQSEVKNPRSLKAVGGGVHFGETAKPAVEFDVSACALRFSKQHGLHLSDGNTQKILIIDQAMSPHALKALYRFAASKRNAAISIGWGTERASFYERLRPASDQRGRSILLDPYFVDTPVGQDLILADTIPWKFGRESLPNGAAIPFRTEFAKEEAAFRLALQETMAVFGKDAVAFRTEDRAMWFKHIRAVNTESLPVVLKAIAEAFPKGKAADPSTEQEAKAQTEAVRKLIDWQRIQILLAFVKGENHQSAKSWFVGQSLADELEVDVGDDPTNAETGSKVRGSLELSILAEVAKQNGDRALSRTDLTPQEQRALDKKVEDTIKAKSKDYTGMFDECMKPLEKEGEDGNEKFLRSLIDVAMTEQFAKGKCPRLLVDLWVALTIPLVEGIPDGSDAINRELVTRFRSTRLAMLYDDAATASRKGETVQLSVQLQYRYATLAITFDDDFVKIGRQDEPGNEVETIKGLTDLTNNNLPRLVADYPPLQRVAHYAEVTAFLRWAIQARGEGKLAAIDFSDLANVPAHDAKAFPTPDSILR